MNAKEIYHKHLDDSQWNVPLLEDRIISAMEEYAKYKLAESNLKAEDVEVYRWVKASERLPEMNKNVIMRFPWHDNTVVLDEGKLKPKEDSDSQLWFSTNNYGSIPEREDGLEWLCKVEPSSPMQELNWDDMHEDLKKQYPIPLEEFGKDFISVLHNLKDFKETDDVYTELRIAANTIKKMFDDGYNFNQFKSPMQGEQDGLWEGLKNEVHNSSLHAYVSDLAIEKLKQTYTLIKKQQ